jgi:Bacterial Ig-like domain
MTMITFLRRPRFGIVALAGLMALLIAGAFSVARAQGQTCRDTGNLTICGDTIDESGQEFQLKGNIKIGPKGGAAVVVVTDMETTFAGIPVDSTTYTARFFHLDAPDPNSGARDVLFGKVRFIKDTNTTPLLATHYVFDPTDSSNLVAGRLFVDPTAKKIFIPAAGAVPIFNQKNIQRNSNMLFPYMDRAALRPFYKDGGTVGEFATIDAEFDLTAKTFTANMPLKLKLTDNADNPNLQVTLKAIFSETGAFSGTVTAFKVVLGGLIVSVDTITLKAGEFTAAKASVAKVDNPDLPQLDPTNAQLLFEFQDLKYKDGKFTIGGVTTPIKDWVFGDAFKMTNQRLGITNDTAAQTAFLTFNSTLEFGAATADAVKVPITAKFSRKIINGVGKPILEAGLQNVSPTIGSMKFNLKGVTLVSDPVVDFFGLKATTVDLQWPPALGGKTAAGVTGFQLGINKAKQLKFALAGGTLATPEFQSGVLKGTLSGTVSVVQETITFILTGNLNVTLPANSGVGTTANLIMRGGKTVRDSCQGVAQSCLLRYEENLSAFSIKLAGFGIGLVNPRGIDDGGFAADQANFTAPAGIGTLANFSGQIVGLTITGAGDVQIAGGGIEMPPLQIGGVNFVGFKGFFAKDDSGYKFTGGATLTMPGLEPNNGKKISAEVTITTFRTGSFKGFGIVVSFTSHPGLPIGQTGMELTTFSGSFNIDAGTATFGVGLGAESKLKLLTLPVVTVNGQASVQINPFKMTLGAQMKILIFQVASASVTIGNGAGFNGGDGIKVDFTVNAVIVHGSAHLHAGSVKGEIDPGTGKDRITFTGSANLAIAIEKRQFGIGLPPFDINIASLGFSGGEFVNDQNRHTFGLKGTISVSIFSAAIFVDMSKSPGQSGFVLLGSNAKNYGLIDAALVFTRARQGEPGYSLRTLPRAEAAQLGFASSPAPVQQLMIPMVVTDTSTAYFGLHYDTSGSPTISLRLPDNSILTESTPNTATRRFIKDLQAAPPAGGGNDRAFMIAGATPGTYTLIINNPPADFKTVAYQLDNPPTLSGVTAARVGNTVNIGWTAADPDTPDAKVSISYVKIVSGTADLSTAQLLTDTLPLGNGTYAWPVNEVPTGNYKVVLSVDDGVHEPTTQIASLVVNVMDTQPPAVPGNLAAQPQPGELLVTWTPNQEKDLAGYQIGFAEVNNVNQFIYTRDMGAKEAGTGQLDAKLWGLKDNKTVYFGIRAYDYDGHFSAWSPLVAATPWALSPNAWTPTPDSSALGSTRVEVAFDTPLLASSISGAIELRDASNVLVAGTQTPIYDLDGVKIVGLSFKPAQSLKDGATYTATLKGGASGIKTVDSRTMPANYTWKFTVANTKVYLPITRR